MTKPEHRNPKRILICHVLACFCMMCFLLILALVVTGQTGNFDDAIREAFYEMRSEGLTRILFLITMTTDKYVIIAICLILLAIPHTRLSFGVPLSAGALGTIILNSIIKHLVQRERPVAIQLVEESGYSFPSGHSITSMFFFGMAIWLIWHNVEDSDDPAVLPDPPDGSIGSSLPSLHYGKRTAIILTILLLIPALFVGMSRVYLGVHFPTDVLGGWALAGVLICIEVIIIDHLERRRQNRTLPGSRSK